MSAIHNFKDKELLSALEAIAVLPINIIGPNTTSETVMQLFPKATNSELEEIYHFIDEKRCIYKNDLEDKQAIPKRIFALRAALTKLNLDGLLVPHSDEYQGEYTPYGSQRLRWITGFSGSAGLAVIMGDTAVVNVDGRYTIQAKEQIDQKIFEIRHLIKEPINIWIEEMLPSGGRLGYDPWHFTAQQVSKLSESCLNAGAKLVRVEKNPIDLIWTNKPPPPLSPVVPHPIEFSGESHTKKIESISSTLSRDDVDVVVINAPDSIAWLLNIRGSDVPNTPLCLSFAILNSNGNLEWYVDERKINNETLAHLGTNIQINPIKKFGAALDSLKHKKVLLDSKTLSSWISDRLLTAEAKIKFGTDPCQLPKACKNNTELDGARAAHIRDGAALTKFLAWISLKIRTEEINELSAQQKLEELRGQGKFFRGLSFDTISSYGANGAIVHYRASSKTNKIFTPGSLYLVDSGGQYLDGTTDVTRTIAIGEPTQEIRERFTRVLKGHIALSRAIFPEGTTGSQLDALARAPLWEAGLDFDHGTGHGVGSYLGVHEGPHGISPRAKKIALRPGMIISNEPGYYEENNYGIRIENLVVVVRVPKKSNDGENLLMLETLTLAPIDHNLISKELLEIDEINWLNSYHARVRKLLSPIVDKKTAAWLHLITQPIKV